MRKTRPRDGDARRDAAGAWNKGRTCSPTATIPRREARRGTRQWDRCGTESVDRDRVGMRRGDHAVCDPST
jgi:hypothetical protein